ncbi:MAG: MarR family winged helix-turn-helix transcriptional regulator [Pseudomonadota bacterium]
MSGGHGRLALKTWLDLLRTANHIKKDIDSRLKTRFGQSISRFDVLSALDRGPDGGLRAGALSRQLVVSEGNITQLMSRLLRDALVERHADPADARAVIYALTPEGRKLFARMAKAHRGWIEDIFSGLSASDLEGIRQLLEQIPPPISEQDVA